MNWLHKYEKRETQVPEWKKELFCWSCLALMAAIGYMTAYILNTYIQTM